MEESLGWDFATLDLDFSSDSPVPCMFCNEEYSFKYDIQHFLTHLLEQHKFVIGKPEEVPDFRQYVLYWNKLRHEDVSSYCIVYLTNTEPGAKNIQETFFLLCDKLPEDMKIRAHIRELKLKYITMEKEREYKKKDFTWLCIFCSNRVISGGVANAFHHLTFVHGFSLGNPDNIVFGEKLLNIIEDKLNRVICLYCERTFKNHSVLKDHMRKKQHRSLNPANKIYDQFYMLNYLKPGTPWKEAKDVLAKEKEYSLADSCPTGDEVIEEEQLWLDWREESTIPATCLFCSFTTNMVPTGLFHHMNTNHNFNFESTTRQLNFYQKVKIINFIRTKLKDLYCVFCNSKFSSSEHLLVHMEHFDHFKLPQVDVWDSQEYMIPALENDGLLLHLEDNDVEDDTSSIASSVNDELILPEDIEVVPCSILQDCKIRNEISNDGEQLFIYKCLFCSLQGNGERPRQDILLHMNFMHNFNMNDATKDLEEDNKIKLVKYIRFMTNSGKCYICQKMFLTKAGLEEHRLIEGHLGCPPLSIFNNKEICFFSQLENDGFLQIPEK